MSCESHSGYSITSGQRPLAFKFTPMPWHRPRTLEVQAAYALWAATYAPLAHNPLMAAEQAALEAMLLPLGASRALDIGTGSGRCRPLLAQTGAAQIVGLDFSMPMLSHNHSSAWLLCAEAQRLPLPATSFDLALASLVAGHLPDLVSWVKETWRVLRPGGQLLYSDFHPDGAKAGWRRTFKTAEGQVFAVRHYVRPIPEQYAALSANGFTVQEVCEPRLGQQPDPQVEAFHRRWGDPPVVVIFRAMKVD